jgi:hypothetical protein
MRKLRRRRSLVRTRCPCPYPGKGTIAQPAPIFWGEVAVVSKTEKQGLRYSDYYWCMSLKDFIEWVEADDDNEPGTSYSDRL